MPKNLNSKDKPNEKRHNKVLKLEILKPTNGMTWDTLGKMLREVRYRTFRLGNLALSEKYLHYYLVKTGNRSEDEKPRKISELNRQLGQYLLEEGVSQEELSRYAKNGGALPSTITDAISQNKLKALTGSKWGEVLRGKTSLPSFRLEMAVPVRCDKLENSRMEKVKTSDSEYPEQVELDLQICLKPYPRVVLKTGKLKGGQREILQRLLENSEQKLEGYRQRCYEIKRDTRSGKWWILVSYDFPAENKSLSKKRCVGVDLGFACPVYVALNEGHARLGWKKFQALAARIRSLQNQTMARRRSMLSGGNLEVSGKTSRSGHGRKRKLKPIEKLEGKIDNAYKTLNHQLSAAVVSFAINHGAGIIQMENLEGLKDKLSGTFLGQRWRYYELQRFIMYKAKEAGIEVKKIQPRYTSRRCSGCGFIHEEFDREARDKNKQKGLTTRFVCPICNYSEDPDYHAARNIAQPDIEKLIRKQCKKQGISNSSEMEENEAE